MIEIVDLTKDLVQFKTMHSKPDEIHRCAAFIEQYARFDNLARYTEDIPYSKSEQGDTPF